MRAIIIATLSAVSYGLLVAGCSTTPEESQPGAKVEDRAKPGAKPGADVRSVDREKTPATDLTASRKDGSSMLKDPNNILSKRTVYFDYDRFDVKDEYRGLVEAHAKYLRENPNAKMLIQGNADERGSREYNIALGQKRSDAVKQLMQLLGTTDMQVETVSFGEEKPKADGHDESAWSQNRRADIVYDGE